MVVMYVIGAVVGVFVGVASERCCHSATMLLGSWSARKQLRVADKCCW